MGKVLKVAGQAIRHAARVEHSKVKLPGIQETGTKVFGGKVTRGVVKQNWKKRSWKSSLTTVGKGAAFRSKKVHGIGGRKVTRSTTVAVGKKSLTTSKTTGRARKFKVKK